MVAPPSPAHLALHVGQAMEDASREALPLSRRTMRSAALASLLPFFLISFGHYFSLTFVLVDYWNLKGRTYYYGVGGRSFWVAGEETADGFVTSVMAIAAVSFLLLCLSTVATVSASSAVNSGRRLTLRESFSRTSGVWRGTSVARLYFTILFLGYVLSLVALVVVSLVIAGNSLRLTTWHFLVSLLVLFSFLYSAVLRSVGLAGSCVPAAEEGGRGVVVVLEAPWTTAVALMEERKLHGLFLFFLSLVMIHGVLLMGRRSFWDGGREAFYDSREWSEGFYMEVRAIQPSPLMPVLMNVPWMLGTFGLFAYVGVLLQV